MKPWTTALFVSLAMPLTISLAAPGLDFMEKFALDDAREEALAELVPGTDDYYYYHALHYQLSGNSPAFDEILNQWVKQRNGSWNEGMKELRRRQFLLNFDKDPDKTWQFLIDDELHLKFNHRPKSAQISPDYPRALDPQRYSLDSFLKRAMARTHPASEFTNAGLALAARQNLNENERRNLLSRLTRSDIPHLEDLIIADLQFKDSRGFGHHTIHRALTLAQLEALAQREPKLLNNDIYISERLARMQPGEEVDIENDPQAAVDFYTTLWNFLKELSPQHNSHKALVLYRLLDAERHTGVYDDARFRQYLALPRNVYYLEAKLRKQWQDQRAVWVNAEHRLPMSIPIDPIRQEEPLVRDFLIQLLKDADSPTAYRSFFEERWLNALFAESKILNGIGAPEQWASKLSPDQYRAIRERIELNFALQNPRQFRPGDKVALDVDTKHIDKLLVKVFEIQAFNYYKQNRAAVNQAIDLDGMVATHERTLTFDTPASQRVRRTLDFPEIDNRGVYVIELIGNGVSSRALVYVGKLEYLTVPTAYGQAVAVLNENGELVKDARLWMAGTEYTPDDEGLILLPYSNAEKVEFIILRQGNFSSPEQLRHLGEPYTFSAGIYVEPQALGRLRTSALVLRPDLRVNGIPLDPAMLEEVKVTLRTSDAKGTPIEREFKPTFTRDREWVTDFFVPDALRELSVSVSARIKQQRDLQKIDLHDRWSISVNGARGGSQLRQIFLVPSADGWFAEVRGVNGEPITGVAIGASLVHPYFTDDTDAHLTTDDQGRVALGPLTQLSTLSINGAEAIPYQINLSAGWASLPSRITVPAGNVVELPHPHAPLPAELPDTSLFQILRGKVLRDAGDAVTIADGRLKVAALEPGTYQLTVHASGQQVEILVSDGPARFGFAIGNLRRLQLSPRLLPLVAKTERFPKSLKVHLANVDASTRVSVVARRYLDSGPEPSTGFGPVTPVVREVRYPFTQYVSGRNIGDEYRYVLERRFAPKFAGSLLGRPGLILNPWMLRETYADREVLRGDEAYEGYAQPMAEAVNEPVAILGKHGGMSPGRRGNFADMGGGGGDMDALMQTTGALGYDFLPQGAILANNLRPAKDGVLLLPLKDIDEQTFVDIYLSDRYGSARYRVLLSDSELTPRDQRLRRGLDPKRSFSRQKRVRLMEPNAPVTFEDIGTARHSVLQTLGDAFDLLQTLGGTADLEQFAFLKQWSTLSEDDKRAKLNEFACHELHIFLYFKDPEFFADVVKPYLTHKKDKTFVDRWLLGDIFKDALDLYALNRRNALEQWLWAERTGNSGRVLNHFTEAWELLPPNPDERNAWILAALNLSGLDERAAGAAADMDEASDYLGKTEQGAGASESAALRSIVSRATFAAAPMTANDRISEREELRASGEKKNRQMDFGLDIKHAQEVDAIMDSDNRDKDGMPDGWENQLEQKAKAQRKRLYRKLPLTTEWAEQNYYKLRAREDVPERLPPSTFWRDLAEGLTLPPSLLGAHRNLTEIICALAISDLRFEAPDVVEDRDGATLTLTVAVPALLVSEEVLPAEASKDARPLLLSQQFFRPDDMYRFEGNEQIEKFVTGEFIRRVVYGGRVTLTNPTASRRRMSVLLQIPVGAVPLQNGFYTDDRTLVLEAYTTQKIDYYFYFPEAGTFLQYPAHAAVDEAIVGKAEPQTFTVVDAPTEIDRTSWEWVSQNATTQEVLDFLSKNNIRRLDLDLMAWRLGDKAFFESSTALLADHMYFHDTSYSYAFKHRDIARACVWLEHSPFAQRVGPALTSTLLTIDPIARVLYEHLEYDPLVNPRAHQVGAERKILNTALREQYLNFLNTQAYYPTLSPNDRLALTYYLALQDRLSEASAQLLRVNRDAVVERIQHDYLSAWMAMRELKSAQARALASPYTDHPVKRWRTRFQNLIDTADEASDGKARVANSEDRQQDIDEQAAKEPALELSVKAGAMTLTGHNLNTCTVNFYPMDIELLFSRKPFLAQDGGDFAVVKPSLSSEVTLLPGGKPTINEIPEGIRDRNMMIEASAAGLQRSQVYYANRLQVRLIENYGQVEVREAGEGGPLPKTYIKVYAKLNNGKVEFWKDGYTDIRGRFDYVSRNDRDPGEVEALSILILHEVHGALIREATPPKQ